MWGCKEPLSSGAKSHGTNDLGMAIIKHGIKHGAMEGVQIIATTLGHKGVMKDILALSYNAFVVHSGAGGVGCIAIKEA